MASKVASESKLSESKPDDLETAVEVSERISEPTDDQLATEKESISEVGKKDAEVAPLLTDAAKESATEVADKKIDESADMDTEEPSPINEKVWISLIYVRV